MEILQQFKELIPPLSNEGYKQLKANCLDEGNYNCNSLNEIEKYI